MPMHTVIHSLRKNKNEILFSYILFFFAGCFLGFFWEVAVYWFTHRSGCSPIEVMRELRGVLHGPWVPVYGTGCLLMVWFRRMVSWRPLKFFGVSVLICSAVEFITSWGLEALFGARWWDYSSQFLNINGRICLGGSLFFGVAGLAVVYGLEPLFQKVLRRWPHNLKVMLCTCLTAAFLLDVCTSLIAPNMGVGVTVTADLQITSVSMNTLND